MFSARFGPALTLTRLFLPGKVARARLAGVLFGFELADQFPGVQRGSDEQRAPEQPKLFHPVHGHAGRDEESAHRAVALPMRVKGRARIQSLGQLRYSSGRWPYQAAQTLRTGKVGARKQA